MFQHLLGPYNKYLRPEFFPTWLIYLSVKIYGLWKAIPAKSILWFTATNPGFALGGLYPTSKYESLKQVPEKWLPATHYIAKDDFEKQYISQLILDSDIGYPSILKPDNGVRGLGIQILHSQDQFDTVIDEFIQKNEQRGDYLLQEFVSDPEEYGIMYTRMPDKNTGSIIGMVKKEFISIHGDGVSTLEYLIHAHPRARYHFPLFAQQYEAIRKTIIPQGEIINVVQTGTHSRGSTFLDVSNLVTEELVRVIDNISHHIEGFYCGRFDIKAQHLKGLLAGKFKIMEVNMTYSEPTWMYDPSYSFIKQQKILLHYWRLVYAISTQNKNKGISYATLKEWFKASKEYNAYLVQ